VVKVAARQDDAMRRWINDRVQRRNPNIATLAVANKKCPHDLGAADPR
jgi:hypothetical protein